MTKEIEKDILNIETRGEKAMKLFVKDRICGSVNLWAPMKKLKYFNWNDICKKIKLKDSKGVIEVKSTNSFLARLLFIAKSNRAIDLEDVISNYEFSVTNFMIMESDGSIIICTNKSQLLHILEDLPSENIHPNPETMNLNDTVLIIDGMCIVNEVISTACPKTCEDLAFAFINVLKCRSRRYESCRLIFDNYDRPDSLKDFLQHCINP